MGDNLRRVVMIGTVEADNRLDNLLAQKEGVKALEAPFSRSYRVKDATWAHFKGLESKAKFQIPLKEDELVDFLTIRALNLPERGLAQDLFLLALEVSARSQVTFPTSWLRFSFDSLFSLSF